MAHSKTDFELSTGDANHYVKLAGEATDVASPEDFRDWVQTSVRKLFPHEMLIAGVAQQNQERVAVDQLLPVDFPIRFIDAVTARRGTFTCPTLETWFQQGQPQLYQPDAQLGTVGSIQPAHEFEVYKLKNVAAHGVSDMSGKFATYFSFSQIPGALIQRHADLLRILVPHLHHAYVRATSVPKTTHELTQRAFCPSSENTLHWARAFHLSDRELEILYWLGMGKTNDEISRTVHRARDTVKHQVSHIFSKLNVSTRQEAVALAIRIGLLPERRSLPQISKAK